MYENFCPNGLWQHSTIIILADITVNVLYHYIDEEWHPYRQKACRKEEMGFNKADIKSVNQQVNEQQYIKILHKVPKTWHLYL